MATAVDFGWIRSKVVGLYGQNGNESVDPIVILKLVFLLFFENVRSARLLMDRLPERLDWLWFCGYDLDSELPDHSVLSKACRRWGRETFARFYRRVVEQCVSAGLVKGRVLHVDGSLIQANAGFDSVGPRLEAMGVELYDQLEQEDGPAEDAPAKISSTDPDARFRTKNNERVLGYHETRVVDDHCGIITASVTADAATEESGQLLPALEQHQEHVGTSAQTVVADKKFGTGENYQQLQDQDMRPCIPHAARTPRAGRLGQSHFTYLPQEDCYTCPQGQRLPYSRHAASKRAYLYAVPTKVCRACPLRAQCNGRRGRIIWRHQHQEAIQWADGLGSPRASTAIDATTNARDGGIVRGCDASRVQARPMAWPGVGDDPKSADRGDPEHPQAGAIRPKAAKSPNAEPSGQVGLAGRTSFRRIGREGGIH